MKVSVVMASRNPDWILLNDAISSILNQTYTDFELIIVDDGSNDPIEPQLKEVLQDKRVKIYRIQNSGLGAALNYGISKANGKYIARLDDDDLMCKDRLEKQVIYMDDHPEVSCLGTQHYDKVRGRYRKHKHYPECHDEIVEAMLTNIRLSMAHTSLMFRKDYFNNIGGYRIAGGGQDADLILQLSRVGRLANLNEYLTFYTMSASGLGTLNPNKQKAYLFAFEEILKQNIYPQYTSQIKNSIERIKAQIGEGQKRVLKTVFKRKLLVLRILILGKNFHGTTCKLVSVQK